MSSVLVFPALVSVFLVSAYLYVKNAFSYWQKKGAPFLKPSFPFGNFKKVFLQTNSISQLLTDIYKSTSEPFIGMFMLLHPSILIRDPEIIQDILVKSFSSFVNRGRHINVDVDPMFDNILMQYGEKWKRSRTIFSPAFTSGKLKIMFELIIDCGSSLQTHIDQFAKSGETIEMRDIFARFASNVIANVAFGIDEDSIKDPNAKFRCYGRRFFEPTIKNAFRFSLMFLSPLFTKLFRVRLADKDIGDFMIETVRRNLKFREKNNVTRKDFFQLLMQLRNTGKVQADDDWSIKAISKEKQLSVEEMAAQAFLFFTAGFESLSTTMSFGMYEFAKNPDIQNKAYNDISTALQRHDGKLTYESIGEMKYIENCIDETLRLHAPFGFLSRQCTKDYELPKSNVVIERGTRVYIPVTALHYDPKYYEQPIMFKPERFDKNVTADKTFIDMPYLPFGDGPRNCVALRFAKLETKVALVILLQKYRFELGAEHANKDLQIDSRSVSKLPIDGINLKVQTR